MSQPSEEKQYDAYVGQVARGAGISTLGQSIGRLLNYVIQVALARMYGAGALGFYVLGITFVWLANVIAQFGGENGLLRFVAHHRTGGDVARVRGTILLSLWATFATSLAIASLLFFSAGFLADAFYSKPFMESVIRIFSVALPLFTLMNMTAFAITGFQTEGGAHRYGTLVRQIVQPLVNLGLIVAFYLLGAEVLGAAAAYVISMAFAAVLALYYLTRVFPKLLDRNTPAKYESRVLFTSSAPMVVANVMPYLSTWTAVTVLGISGTSVEVGVYNAAARTGTLSALVLFGFAGIFSPMVSSLYKKGALDHLGYLYKDVSRWAFTGSLAVFLLTVLLDSDIMAVFGPEFVAGRYALIIVAGAQLFSSSVGLTARVLSMTGHQKMVMLATVGSTILGVLVTLALVPSYGILGAAAATTVAIVSSNVITLLSVRRVMGFWPYGKGYLKPITAGALALAGCFAAKLALPLPVGILTILTLAPLFLAVFAALLLILGLSPSDRQFSRTLWRAVRRRIFRTS